jgi:hypothetical protein
MLKKGMKKWKEYIKTTKKNKMWTFVDIRTKHEYYILINFLGV